MANQLQQVGRIRLAAVALAAAVLVVGLSAGAGAQEPVTLCHAAGKGYVQITVSGSDIEGHVDHEDDIVPAPPEGCPDQVVPDAGETPGPVVTATPTATPTPRERAEERREDRRRDEPGSGGGSQPAPAATAVPFAPGTPAAQAAPSSQSQPDPAATGPRGLDGLPVTGSRPDLVALAALGLLLAGAGLRLRVGPALRSRG